MSAALIACILVAWAVLGGAVALLIVGCASMVSESRFGE
jgi:hypothetical protein